MRTFNRRLLGAFVLLLAGCGGGGGGGGGGISFSVAGISPAVSNDLAGGDTVTITGTNFITAGVANVTFGGVPATNRQILSETEMTVDTPAAPGGVPQTVTVVVSTLHGGSDQLVNGYTYSSSTPSPVSISPTTFTPTGAEDFTITGTTLGPLGGQVSVVFQGIGTVSGTVSANGQSVTGRAPVTGGVPPVGPVTVTLDTGAATADVPVTVTYPFVLPLPVPEFGQTLGNASRPVRLADGFAAFCTAGADLTWGTADDDIRILRGPPSGILTASVPPRGAPGAPVGYLSAVNSIPAVLGPDTFAVYATSATGATSIVLVTLARTTPVADIFPMPSMAAPIAAIGPSRIALLRLGTQPGPQDELLVQDFNLAAAPPGLNAPIRVAIPVVDATAGAGNFSIPFSPDGDAIFSMDLGPNGTARDTDDRLVVRVVSAGTTNFVPAASLLGRPIAFSANFLVAPGAGANATFGNGDDTLQLFSLSGTWSNNALALGQALNVAALVPYARFGDGIAVAVTGGIKAYTNPATGTNSLLTFPGAPLFAPLGGGGLAVFGPGPNLTPMTGGDDQASLIDALGVPQSFGQIPNLTQTVIPLTDADRAFALSPGGDGVFATADDVLEVYQSRAIAAANSASRLPAAVLPIGRVTANTAFVPVGPGWGVMQSPGPDATWVTIDDTLVIIRY